MGACDKLTTLNSGGTRQNYSFIFITLNILGLELPTRTLQTDL